MKKLARAIREELENLTTQISDCEAKVFQETIYENEVSGWDGKGAKGEALEVGKAYRRARECVRRINDVFLSLGGLLPPELMTKGDPATWAEVDSAERQQRQAENLTRWQELAVSTENASNHWRSVAAELAGVRLTDKMLEENLEALTAIFRKAASGMARKIHREALATLRRTHPTRFKAEIWVARPSSDYGYFAVGPLGQKAWLDAGGAFNMSGGVVVAVDQSGRTITPPAGLQAGLRALYVSDPIGAYLPLWRSQLHKDAIATFGGYFPVWRNNRAASGGRCEAPRPALTWAEGTAQPGHRHRCDWGPLCLGRGAL